MIHPVLQGHLADMDNSYQFPKAPLGHHGCKQSTSHICQDEKCERRFGQASERRIFLSLPHSDKIDLLLITPPPNRLPPTGPYAGGLRGC